MALFLCAILPSGFCKTLALSMISKPVSDALATVDVRLMATGGTTQGLRKRCRDNGGGILCVLDELFSSALGCMLLPATNAERQQILSMTGGALPNSEALQDKHDEASRESKKIVMCGIAGTQVWKVHCAGDV